MHSKPRAFGRWLWTPPPSVILVIFLSFEIFVIRQDDAIWSRSRKETFSTYRHKHWKPASHLPEPPASTWTATSPHSPPGFLFLHPGCYLLNIIKSVCDLRVVAWACNSCLPQIGGSQAEGLPELHSESDVSLRYLTRPFQRTGKCNMCVNC